MSRKAFMENIKSSVQKKVVDNDEYVDQCIEHIHTYVDLMKQCKKETEGPEYEDQNRDYRQFIIDEITKVLNVYRDVYFMCHFQMPEVKVMNEHDFSQRTVGMLSSYLEKHIKDLDRRRMLYIEYINNREELLLKIRENFASKGYLEALKIMDSNHFINLELTATHIIYLYANVRNFITKNNYRCDIVFKDGAMENGRSHFWT